MFYLCHSFIIIPVPRPIHLQEKDKEIDLFFINTIDGYITTEKTEFINKEQTFAIEKKKRVLSKLSQKWGVDNLNKLLETLQNPLDKFREIELYQKTRDNLKKYIELEEEAENLNLLHIHLSPISV